MGAGAATGALRGVATTRSTDKGCRGPASAAGGRVGAGLATAGKAGALAISGSTERRPPNSSGSTSNGGRSCRADVAAGTVSAWGGALEPADRVAGGAAFSGAAVGVATGAAKALAASTGSPRGLGVIGRRLGPTCVAPVQRLRSAVLAAGVGVSASTVSGTESAPTTGLAGVDSICGAGATGAGCAVAAGAGRTVVSRDGGLLAGVVGGAVAGGRGFGADGLPSSSGSTWNGSSDAPCAVCAPSQRHSDRVSRIEEMTRAVTTTACPSRADRLQRRRAGTLQCLKMRRCYHPLTDPPMVTAPDPQRDARRQALEAWLAEVLAGQLLEVQPASADASFRRYFRVKREGLDSLIAMDAPPPHEDCRKLASADAGCTSSSCPANTSASQASSACRRASRCGSGAVTMGGSVSGW